MKLNQSFSARLSLYIIIATSFLCILGLVGAEISAVHALNNSVSKDTKGVLETQIKDIEKILVEVEGATENMIWVVNENKDDPDYMYKISERIVEYNPYVIGAAVAFEPYYYPSKGRWFSPYAYGYEDGTIISYQCGSDDYDYFKEDWYQLPKVLNANMWVDPYYDEDNASRGLNQYLTTYSVPLWDEDGRLFAVLQSDVSLQDITDKLSSLEGYEHSYSMLLGRSGSFISHPDSVVFSAATIFEYADEEDNEDIMDLGRNMIAGKTGAMIIEDHTGEKSYVAYGSLSNGWSMAIVCPYADIYKDIKKVNVILFILILLELLLLFIVIRRIVGRVTKPITEFAYSALAIGKGNFKARLPEIKTRDELKWLHDSLEYMLMSFNDYIEQLKMSTKSNERYESELNIASNIQRQMLPSRFPQSDKFDIYAKLTPAKEVGGDLFDFIVKDNYLYVAIGDVSGKGVPAALYMAITRYAFNFIAGLGLGVDGVVGKVNNSFCEGNSWMMFVTMFIAKINLETYEMEFCNAGHNPIVIKNPDGETRYLRAKANLAIGLMKDFPYEKEKIQLCRGSRLLLYTDGVTEAENVDKNLYGEDRLLEFAQNIAEDASSRNVIDSLFSSVKSFTKENDQNDDITVLTVKLL